MDVSDVQLLRWYGKRVDVRKPTLRFGEIKDALLELVPHYFDDGPDKLATASAEHAADATASDAPNTTGVPMEVDTTTTQGDSPDTDAQAEIARAELDRIVLPRTAPAQSD